jgi:hypothetical protein
MSNEVNTETKMNADTLLESAKGEFDAVVVCGFDKEGNIKMFCHPDQTIVAHWILSKSQFELNLYEKARPKVEEEKSSEV